jgi:hypothetical protein
MIWVFLFNIMATYRKLHTTFWTDPFVENLTQQQKLFYLYLITNTKTKQSGIYEITKKYMEFETGFSIGEVSELIAYFVNDGKILYSEKTNEIAIVNWVKHNLSISHSVLKCIETDLYEVKDKDLVRALYKDDYIQLLKSVPEATKTTNGKMIGGPYTPLIEYLESIHSVGTECTHSVYTTKQQEQEQEEAQTQQQAYAQAYAQVKTEPQTLEEALAEIGYTGK